MSHDEGIGNYAKEGRVWNEAARLSKFSDAMLSGKKMLHAKHKGRR